MNDLLRVLKEAAIFMLCAQVLLHLGPGKKYEKYGKMIVSLLLLAQLASPLLSLMGGSGETFTENLSRYEQENAAFVERMEQLSADSESMVLAGMVQSVEEQLAAQAKSAGVRIDRVTLSQGRLVIEVGAQDVAGRIRVGPVTLDEQEQEEQQAVSGRATASWARPDLAAAFAKTLGISEESVEVVEYG